MAGKHRLRKTRAATVINTTSKRQEKDLTHAIADTVAALEKKYPLVQLEHQSSWRLAEIVDDLRHDFPDVDFHYHHERSSMRPDGGILFAVATDGSRHPILIAEKKNQGTNDLRKLEGKKKQAKGNAIERLGKNVIGFRAALKGETIFPFVCFGDGCDFADDSSILDRVSTIAMFGQLNEIHLHDVGGPHGFDRGSFYFRVEEWTRAEMAALCTRIAASSLLYYASKYGEAEVFGEE